jgi:hypothetical protein
MTEYVLVHTFRAQLSHRIRHDDKRVSKYGFDAGKDEDSSTI